jgi:hypothetical protein
MKVFHEKTAGDIIEGCSYIQKCLRCLLFEKNKFQSWFWEWFTLTDSQSSGNSPTSKHSSDSTTCTPIMFEHNRSLIHICFILIYQNSREHLQSKQLNVQLHLPYLVLLVLSIRKRMPFSRNRESETCLIFIKDLCPLCLTSDLSFPETEGSIGGRSKVISYFLLE